MRMDFSIEPISAGTGADVLVGTLHLVSTSNYLDSECVLG